MNLLEANPTGLDGTGGMPQSNSKVQYLLPLPILAADGQPEMRRAVNGDSDLGTMHHKIPGFEKYTDCETP